MENEGNRPLLFDASPYVLIEQTADSDAHLLESDAAPAGEDDAESSCSRSARSSEEDHAAADLDGGRSLGKDLEDDDGGDSEDGVVDQCRRGKIEGKRSNGCDVKKMMSEREGDRLFWEACLASL